MAEPHHYMDFFDFCKIGFFRFWHFPLAKCAPLCYNNRDRDVAQLVARVVWEQVTAPLPRKTKNAENP